MGRFYDYDDKTWVIDIETDSLVPTVVWCLCAINVASGEEVSLTGDENIRDWVEARLQERAVFIGHNIVSFDAATLNRLLDARIPVSRLADTMLMSLLYSTALEGGHSLEAWGRRLKYPKGEFNDFSHLSEDMVAYCLNDCRLTLRVYRELIARLQSVSWSETGLDIEHSAWGLIQLQRRNGFPFDKERADVLYAHLRGLENDIRDELYIHYPPTLELVRHFARSHRRDGTPTEAYLRHSREYVLLERHPDGSYDGYDLVPFNIGSPDQRVSRLLALGWRPTEDEKTPTGKPKPTVKGHLVPSLVRFVEESGRPEPALIAKWMEINARGNMVNTWIDAVQDDGRIHGSLWMANTLRYTHSNPNTANIPAVRVGKDGRPLVGEEGVFTYEARDLWTTADRFSRRLVGVDAKGIQLRVLAHYLNNPEFTEAVLGDDPHTYNQGIGGFQTRAVAKTFIYAYLLGAGDAQVGKIIGGSPKDGKAIKARFLANFPGLKGLMTRLEREIQATGRIKLCDGSRPIVSQPHARLGYLLQGDESRIMKKATILIAAAVRKVGLDVVKVGDIHDEHQYDVALKDVEAFKALLPGCFAEAGKFFNYRLPIECSVNVGLTWAMTH